MITALLLAAGQGERMGKQAKALLVYDGHTFLKRALLELDRAGLDECAVVTGAHHTAVCDELGQLAAEFPPGWVREVHNPHYAQGMLSSIQAGIRSCLLDSEAVLITLVDLPKLDSKDYAAMVKSYKKGKPGMLYRGMNQGKAAHPVLISRNFFPEILEHEPADTGCAFLFKNHPELVRYQQQSHDGGLIDIDSWEDYRAHLSP